MTNELLSNYAPIGPEFIQGLGCYLYDKNNNKYLDFSSGIAVNILGHSHKGVVSAIKEQAEKVLHISNLYHIPLQNEVASQLINLSSADDYKVFFCNSGAEAMEASIKFARYFHFNQFPSQKIKQQSTLLVLDGAFHGRTLATIFSAGKKNYCEGFGPEIPGFIQVSHNKPIEIEKHLKNEGVAGIIIEPIQGENGVQCLNNEFLTEISKICKNQNKLLIVDEIQSGLGRTGKMWAHQHAGIVPDIIATAKGLANGIPVGAVLSRIKVAQYITPGKHGSTFGGNPLAMSAAKATLAEVSKDNFIENVAIIGKYLHKSIQHLARRHQRHIYEIRGKGLFIGIQLQQHIVARGFCKNLLNNNLLVVPAANNTIRLLPSLIITKNNIDEAVQIIDKTLMKIGAENDKK